MQFSNEIPEDILMEASDLGDDLLPKKSRDKYREEFAKFEKWQQERNLNSIEEPVMLVYFNNLYQNFKPTTVQSHHSMIKAILKIDHDIDIGNYHKLNALMRTKSVGYEPTKSNVFEPEDILKFLNEAPDKMYLDHKVCKFFFFFFITLIFFLILIFHLIFNFFYNFNFPFNFQFFYNFKFLFNF